MVEHINGYALALLSLAKEENKLKQYKTQSEQIIESIEENPKYLEIMSTKSIDKEVKKELISAAFARMNKNLLNLMFILSERHKFKMLVHILEKLIKFINTEEKINEGIVYTNEKLTPATIKSLEKKVSTSLGLKVKLVNKLDAEIISGFRIIVDDQLIEDTIESRLAGLKETLLCRKED